MEWNFTYENQEASSFLVYQLQKEEQLDTVGMGMLGNNQIPHILPVLYTQINENRYLRYAVPSRIPLDSFLGGMVSKERLLNVLTGICESIEESQAYMLDSSMLVLDKRYIFANVTTGEVAMVYLPVQGQSCKNSELSSFFKEIMFGTQFDSGEDCSYIAAIINYLNKSGNFLVNDFRKLLQELQNKTEKSSVLVQEKPSVGEKVVVSAAKPVPVPKKPTTSTTPSRPVALPKKPTVVPQPESILNKSETQPQSEKVSKKSKGIPFPSFGSKKSKENAAVDSGTRKKTEMPLPPSVGVKKVTIPVPSAVASEAKVQKPISVPQKSVSDISREKQKNSGFSKVKVPVAEKGQQISQVNFGETSVLCQEAGQTTVLGSSSGKSTKTDVLLVRKKNGQKVTIDKSLFRIGTERAFVDYWISDNTAVSRSHADIINHEGSFYIRDNNSTNHTYLNGTILISNQEYLLQDGDWIILGNEEFEFTIK